MDFFIFHSKTNVFTDVDAYLTSQLCYHCPGFGYIFDVNKIIPYLWYNYQLYAMGSVVYALIYSRDENIRRGRRPSGIFLGVSN